MVFDPGAGALRCRHCGVTADIPESDAELSEVDYSATLAGLEANSPRIERLTVRCAACGANVQFDDNVTSKNCCFCGSPIVAEAVSQKCLRPSALLPFRVSGKDAIASYRRWLHSLWLAPTDLSRHAELDGALVGTYMPFWTYDCVATTTYSGFRGEDYWDTETYTTVVNGQRRTMTRRVRKTRWYPASGTVVDRFDDVLIPASASLPISSQTQAEPWDLEACVPYRDEFLAGFRSESYSVTLTEGFEGAKVRMKPRIEASIRGDIGGDRQRITSATSRYDRVTFKHLLLPMWLSAYRYKRRIYRVLINGRTGELIGDRPWSAWKISGLVLLVLALAGLVGLALMLTRS